LIKTFFNYGLLTKGMGRFNVIRQVAPQYATNTVNRFMHGLSQLQKQNMNIKK